jgi:glycosyltransferase involved in cell wall biosynthesis
LIGDTDFCKNYILITACKNEEINLQSLIDSIASQKIKPIVWVIVDDGSTDNTSFILERNEVKYDWIKVLRLEQSPRDLGLHLSEVLKKGFEYSINYCKLAGLEYSYLGNVDADLTLPPTFFSYLIDEFGKDPELGIASGGTDNVIGNKKIRAKISIDEPSGGHMLIRKACFEDCGGFPISYMGDSVLKTKARLKGWKTLRFEEQIATEIRDISVAQGYWKGFRQKGQASHYVNHNPLHVFIKTLKYSFKKPYYIGIAYLIGYLDSFFKRKERINDIELKNYYWNKWKEHL